MIDFLQDSAVWIVTIGLMLAGIVGCIVPVIPGHLLIFGGAVGYRLMVGPEAGIPWWSFVILFVLMAVSQVFEIMSGSLGTKWFGGSKWGAAGALIGGIVGLFFFPFGLLLGPLIGAFGFEMAFAKKKTRESAVSGVGSVVGIRVGSVVSSEVG